MQHTAQALTSLSFKNKEAIDIAGSFTCSHCFTTSDDASDTCDNGQTVLCPNCGVDACIPTLTAELLEAASAIQF